MTTYIAGLDLGQLADYSAFVVLEQTHIPDPHCAGRMANSFDVRHIHRWHLGTPYTQIVTDLRLWYCEQPLHNTTLIVDKTGVGVAVADMITEARLHATVKAFTITAGFKPGDGTVPKQDLVGVVQAALGTNRLRFADELEHTQTLTAELKAFRTKVTPDRNETYASFRERDHDDLVLALALALWYGEEQGVWSDNPYVAPYDEPIHGDLPADTFS